MKSEVGTQPIENLTTPAHSPLLDPRSAGVVLGGEEKPITPATLADWRTKKQGPRYVRIGRLIRYRLADLTAWIDSRTIGEAQQ